VQALQVARVCDRHLEHREHAVRVDDVAAAQECRQLGLSELAAEQHGVGEEPVDASGAVRATLAASPAATSRARERM